MHTLGFYHMHASSEASEYINILWDNIQEGKMQNFIHRGYSHEIDYNYDSIMHFPKNAFGIDGSDTIVALKVKFLNNHQLTHTFK